MSDHTRPWLLTASRQLYGALLRLYPASFRAAYGREMRQLFADCCRDAIARSGLPGLLALWLRTLGDLAVSAPRERFAVVRQQRPVPRPAVVGGGQIREHRTLDGFTRRAHASLRLAFEEANRLGHLAVGSDHLLLGLLREQDSLAARVLREPGLEQQRTREAVWFLHVLPGQAQRVPTAALPAATGAQKAQLDPQLVATLDAAAAEASALGHFYVGTEHLLLALLRPDDGLAAAIFDLLQLQPERVRDRVLQIVQPQTTPPTPDSKD
jgi:hypothetical protein